MAGSRALEAIGFNLDDETKNALISGKDFVQIKDGPFDVDVIHAPDGIDSFEAAKKRSITEDIFPVANLSDIIASKKASNRRKDLVDLDLLEEFAKEYDQMHPKLLATALDRVMRRLDDAGESTG